MSKRTTQPAEPAAGEPAASDAAAVRAAYAAGAAADLARQAERVRRAKAAARREQAKLGRMTAGAVSADPTAVTWYARPGILNLAQAIAALPGASELSVHRAVERYRARATRGVRR